MTEECYIIFHRTMSDEDLGKAGKVPSSEAIMGCAQNPDSDAFGNRDHLSVQAELWHNLACFLENCYDSVRQTRRIVK